MTKDIQEHKRINDILLGPLERPALHWLAENMPGWVTPDLLTAVGLMGSLIALAGYGLSSYDPLFLWLASLGFIINWFGDSLDGTLARYRHIERPIYGFYIDHSMDIVTEALFFIGLGISPYVLRYSSPGPDWIFYDLKFSLHPDLRNGGIQDILSRAWTYGNESTGDCSQHRDLLCWQSSNKDIWNFQHAFDWLVIAVVIPFIYNFHGFVDYQRQEAKRRRQPVQLTAMLEANTIEIDFRPNWMDL